MSNSRQAEIKMDEIDVADSSRSFGDSTRSESKTNDSDTGETMKQVRKSKSNVMD